MAEYRYRFYDCLSGASLGALPLQGVEFDHALNGIGNFRGYLPLGDPRVTAANPLGVPSEARTEVYVDRDGVIQWGGLVWHCERRQGASQVSYEILAEEFGSYYGKRIIRHDLAFAAQDQLEIARDLFRYAAGLPLVAATGTPTFSQPNGNVRLFLGTETSGRNRDRTYLASELATVWQRVSELGAVIDGFDYSIDCVYDTGGVPRKTFVPGYPRRGRTSGETALLFQTGANIDDYALPRDGYQIATGVLVKGSDANNAQLTSTASSAALLAAGYPAIELTESYSTVVDQATLDGHAQAVVALHGQALQLPTLSVRADRRPVLGSYIVGDECRVRLDDAYGKLAGSSGLVDELVPAPWGGFIYGVAPWGGYRRSGATVLDAKFRINSIRVQVGDNSSETVTLGLGPVV